MKRVADRMRVEVLVVKTGFPACAGNQRTFNNWKPNNIKKGIP